MRRVELEKKVEDVRKRVEKLEDERSRTRKEAMEALMSVFDVKGLSDTEIGWER